MKTRNLKLVCLLLEMIGIAALFLPFTYGVPPWAGALSAYWPSALPALLAPLVCLQTLRSFFPQPLNKRELWLCAGLVGLLSLLPLGRNGVYIIAEGKGQEVLYFWLFYGLAVVVAGLLLMLKRKGVSSEFLAPIALRGAYVPNAVYCLLGFSYWGRYWDLLEVGATCVAATVLLYLVEIAYLTKQGLKTRRGPSA